MRSPSTDPTYWRKKAIEFRSQASKAPRGVATLLRKRAAEFDAIGAALSDRTRETPSPDDRWAVIAVAASYVFGMSVIATGLWAWVGEPTAITGSPLRRAIAGSPVVAVSIIPAANIAADGHPAEIEHSPDDTRGRSPDFAAAASPAPGTETADNALSPMVPAEPEAALPPGATAAADQGDRPSLATGDIPQSRELPAVDGIPARRARLRKAQVEPFRAATPVELKMPAPVPRVLQAGSPGENVSPASTKSVKCLPYTAPISILGQARPVRGTACRLPDGGWMVRSEIPG